MRRREFIAGLLLAPTMQRAEAQQSAKPYRIAVVHQSASVAEMSETADNPYYRALFKELRRLGYAEGKNLVVERYSGGGREEFTELSRDVVRTKPDVIVASSSRVVLSFKAATDTIPIVSSLADPVAYGIAASIAHPGGNITGVSVDAGLDIWSKRLQLLHEAVPTLSRVGYLGPQQS